ncbi:MAG TPA: tyrosine-type recombinase/integrase [Anaerolineales bacterium]|nr:tyrosine-type recombinase/integrase [Anaerolineales bacterium]
MTKKQTALLPADTADLKAVIALALDGLTSDHSRRAYEKALTDFMAWYQALGKPGLSKATVQRYKTVLQESGLSPSTVNLRLSAIRKLAQEAADNGMIDPTLANGIARVKGVKSAGVRVGNWLTREQAQALLDAPDVGTLKGLRDRALLAVMMGAGLRRSEVAALTVDHVQQREGRWVIVDLIGKGNRTRSVPIPSWTKAALDAWASAARIHAGRVFRAIHKGGYVDGESLTPQAARDVAAHYGAALGLSVAAHDLRRTYAKLAHKGGAGLDQIQLSLGHASIRTTERYLGVEQDLTDAPGDRLGLKLNKAKKRDKSR